MGDDFQERLDRGNERGRVRFSHAGGRQEKAVPVKFVVDEVFDQELVVFSAIAVKDSKGSVPKLQDL
jgi:hypothetical protein